jgi:hypothetical protein
MLSLVWNDAHEGNRTILFWAACRAATMIAEATMVRDEG